MNTLTFTLLIGLIVPVSLSAQIKPVQKSTVQTKKILVQKQQAISRNQVLKHIDHTTAPVSLNCKVNSVKESQAKATNLSPVGLTNITELLTTNSGSPAYTNGNGVVLDALNAHDAQTGSVLFLAGVEYNSVLFDQIKNNQSATIKQKIYGSDYYVLAAVFENMPTSPHLFLLTIGSSYNLDKTFVYVSDGYCNFTEVPKDRIVPAPESSEFQILISGNAVYDPEVGTDYQLIYWFGNTFKTRFPFIVVVAYDICGSCSYESYFHHIQLVQIN